MAYCHFAFQILGFVNLLLSYHKIYTRNYAVILKEGTWHVLLAQEELLSFQNVEKSSDLGSKLQGGSESLQVGQL